MNPLFRWFIIKKINNLTKRIKGGEIDMSKGMFTSEFYITLIGGIVTAICQALKLDPEIQNSILKLVLVYVASRTVVKTATAVTNGKK